MFSILALFFGFLGGMGGNGGVWGFRGREGGVEGGTTWLSEKGGDESFIVMWEIKDLKIVYSNFLEKFCHLFKGRCLDRFKLLPASLPPPPPPPLHLSQKPQENIQIAPHISSFLSSRTRHHGCQTSFQDP